MATVIPSNDKVLISSEFTFDIRSKYKELMEAATGQGSAYIRTKETLLAMVEASELTPREKAEIVAKTLGGIATSVTEKAMDMAYRLQKDEFEMPYLLGKIVVDNAATRAQISKIDNDTELTAEQKAKIVADTTATQVNTYINQITAHMNTGATAQYTASGDKLTSAATLSDVSLMGRQRQQIEAGIYDKWASSLMSYGTNISGLPTGIVMPTNATLATDGLVYEQTRVARRQEQAFDDNMRQHAANSSATMIGMLLGAELPDTITEADVQKWRDSVGYLTTDVFETTGSIAVTSTGTLTIGSTHTISGTVNNITAGKQVSVSYSWDNNGVTEVVSDDAAWDIVLKTLSWTITVPATVTSKISAGKTVTCTVKVQDNAGVSRTASFTKNT